MVDPISLKSREFWLEFVSLFRECFPKEALAAPYVSILGAQAPSRRWSDIKPLANFMRQLDEPCAVDVLLKTIDRFLTSPKSVCAGEYHKQIARAKKIDRLRELVRIFTILTGDS